VSAVLNGEVGVEKLRAGEVLLHFGEFANDFHFVI
jgi:hypothetical protein